MLGKKILLHKRQKERVWKSAFKYVRTVSAIDQAWGLDVLGMGWDGVRVHKHTQKKKQDQYQTILTEQVGQ